MAPDELASDTGAEPTAGGAEGTATPRDDSATSTSPGRGSTAIFAGRGRSRIARIALPVLFAVVFLTVWELYAQLSGIRESTLPAPSRVIEVFLENRAVLFDNARVTGIEIVVGYLAAVVFGTVLGVVIHASIPLERTLYPWLVASQTVPILAIAPVIVTWLGFGIESKITVVVLLCFFPIAVNTIDGLRSANPELLDLMRAMGASPFKRFWSASVPAALPSIFSGLKVGAALASVGAVIGEWVGSSAGLGYLILAYNSQIRTAHVFAVIVLLSVMGLALFGVVVVLERVTMPWYHGRSRERG